MEAYFDLTNIAATSNIRNGCIFISVGSASGLQEWVKILYNHISNNVC